MSLALIQAHGFTLKPPSVLLSSHGSQARHTPAIRQAVRRWTTETQEGRVWAAEQTERWLEVGDRADTRRHRTPLASTAAFEPDRVYLIISPADEAA